MKPKTKTEKALVALAPTLRPLTEHQRAWTARLVPDEALYHSRRGRKSEMKCLQCGHVHSLGHKWDIDADVIQKWTCPECGAVCAVLPQFHDGWYGSYDKRTGRQSVKPTLERCATLADRCGDWQVFRTFAAEKVWKADGSSEILVHERFQSWVSPEGREHIIRQNYERLYWNIRWRYDRGWGVGKHNPTHSGYWYRPDMFRLDGTPLIPGGRLTPLLRRNGWSKGLVGEYPNGDPVQTAVALLEAPVEKILKMGQRRLAAFVIRSQYWREKAESLLPSVRICTRHGYDITMPDTWLDLMHMLREAGKDLRNPHFVCPKDLVREHDRMVEAIQKIRSEEEEKKRRKEALEWEGQYHKAKQAYLGIAFGNGDIVVSVIPSVAAVLEEGTRMHHCVFRAGYYKREGSLLLSARDKEGNRLETVEIDLNRMAVAQSRGLKNNPTDRHEEIVRLCEENMNVIRSAKAGKGFTAA